MVDLSGQDFGRYRIIKLLGTGDLVATYMAHDTRLEIDVVISLVQSNVSSDSRDMVLKRFDREAKSLAKLSHPNIIKLYDYGDRDGSPYLVMEYRSGRKLTKLLGKPTPWKESVRLIAMIARGVAYAHKRGVLHRDINPDTVLIADDGDPLLLDFGVAKILKGEQTSNLTASGMAVGTPRYMAPEQWTGLTSPASDQYSLGVILYELVTGRTPYLGNTPADILIQQATQPITNPRELVEDLPESVVSVLIKVLAKKPEDRYQEVNDFISALENLLATGSTESDRLLKVFLCHAHNDKNAVKALYNRLVKDGVDAWLDKEKLLPGQDWEMEIRKAVRENDVVVVCLSRHFRQAGFRQKEVRLALDTAMEQPEGEIFIIPARLEECDTLESLRKWHWVDLFEENGYEMLMKALRQRAGSIGAVLKNQDTIKQKPPSRASTKEISDYESTSTEPFEDEYETISNDRLAAGSDLSIMSREQLKELATAMIAKGESDSLIRVLYALGQIESGQEDISYWKPPYGEPEWVTVPAGEFWMGSESDLYGEAPLHRLHLPEYKISIIPVTNAQYDLYVKDNNAKPPNDWRGGQMPDGMEKYPVTKVTWFEALGYCKWLGEKIGHLVRLPNEAEWEKAARGVHDQRDYPWGEWADLCCNSAELGLNGPTPVDLFPTGKSPYGVLDLSGNIWEWTSSEYKKYPYNADDGREDLKNTQVKRVLRGGSFANNARRVRCFYRYGVDPLRSYNGFRLVISSQNRT